MSTEFEGFRYEPGQLVKLTRGNESPQFGFVLSHNVAKLPCDDCFITFHAVRILVEGKVVTWDTLEDIELIPSGSSKYTLSYFVDM